MNALDAGATHPGARWRLHGQGRLDDADLRFEAGSPEEVRLSPGPGEVELDVEACGVCRTDLHEIEGDIPPHRLPVVPGHQVVGRVVAVGSVGSARATVDAGAAGVPSVGSRVGVGWLASACGRCAQCRSGRENLCPTATFTGWDVDGGYATRMVARADFTYLLPDALGDAAAVAPLLCGGVIGYRALRLAGVLDAPGGRLLLVGFGNSASIALQAARARGWACTVSTRSETHRSVAAELGARIAPSDLAPASHDAAIIFAPAGSLVPDALRAVVPGGTVACAGITMSDLPGFPYDLLYGERTLRSVANATRRDALDLLELAARTGIRTEVERFQLADARVALGRVAASSLRASAVLVPA